MIKSEFEEVLWSTRKKSTQKSLESKHIIFYGSNGKQYNKHSICQLQTKIIAAVPLESTSKSGTRKMNAKLMILAFIGIFLVIQSTAEPVPDEWISSELQGIFDDCKRRSRAGKTAAQKQQLYKECEDIGIRRYYSG